VDTPAALLAFSEPERLWSRTELIGARASIPATPGIYGWYFDVLPHPAITGVGTVVGAWSLLYVGIAPGRPGSTSNLRKRLGNHLTGNARGSTLRLSLGSLLSEQLGLTAVPASGKVSFGTTEAILSKWMDDHARVTWLETPDPWAIEAEVVRTLQVPLNRDHNQAHPFYATMGQLRAARRSANRTSSGRGEGSSGPD